MLTLFAHPFSSYSQKVLIALWENAIPFEYRHLEAPGAGEELAAPLRGRWSRGGRIGGISRWGRRTGISARYGGNPRGLHPTQAGQSMKVT